MSTMILFVFLALSISVNAPVQDRCGSVYPENASDRPDELVQLHEIKSGLAADLLNQLKAKAGFNGEILLCGGYPAKYGISTVPRKDFYGISAMIVSDEMIGFSEKARMGAFAHELGHIFLEHDVRPPSRNAKELYQKEFEADEFAVRLVGPDAIREALMNVERVFSLNQWANDNSKERQRQISARLDRIKKTSIGP